MAPHGTAKIPKSCVGVGPKHPKAQVDCRINDASDTDSPESDQPTKNNGVKPLISPSAFARGLFVDLLSVLVSVAFLVFAVKGTLSNDKEIRQQERTLLNIAPIVATAFPYCFALILGRTLQAILSSRMERGVDCLSLAYLTRSQTLGGTLTAPLHIRLGHWLPAALIALWAFSPLGSQASLRFISLQTRPLHELLDRPVHYSYPVGTWVSACVACRLPARNSLLQAAFQSAANTWNVPQDSWGNVKVPMLEDLGDADMTDGWRDVTNQPEYTSLVGIPLRLPPGHGNMSFMMESWYWEFTNASLWEVNSTAPLLESAHEYNDTDMLTNLTGINNLWQFAIPVSLPDAPNIEAIPITFEASTAGWPLQNSLNFPYTYGNHLPDYIGEYSSIDEYRPISIVRLDAVLVQTPVQLKVTCASLSTCRVTSARKINLPVDYNTDDDMMLFIRYILPHLTKAFTLEGGGSPRSSILEAYLYDPHQNPYNTLSGRDVINIQNISAVDLGRRLTQAINSYWLVENQFSNIVSGFNTSSETWPRQDYFIRNSTITTTETQEYLRCDTGWAVALCLACVVALLAALVSAALGFFRLAPDCTDFLSALTLTDGRMVLEGGSSLDEYERARLLKDVRLKVGDSRSWEQVGHTSIAQDGHVGDLKKSRLYW
ncbi:hypothetical protein PG990_010486 [Apiospora arundinis]